MATLEVEDLRTHLSTRWGVVRAVDGVSFSIDAGETLGLVGESGSGKSMTCWSIVRLLPRSAHLVQGSVRLEGEEILEKSDSELTRIRGRKIGMILQDPMSSLNPVLTIGKQLGECVALHHDLRGRALHDRVVELLTEVGIPAAALRSRQYPHELSGGMRQRVVGAMAIAAPPKLLIADEPTTALDPTVQVQYLDLLRRIHWQRRMAFMFVSHDLRVVANLCSRVAVMYAGRIVETGATERIWSAPAHPYTQGLVASIPRFGAARRRLATIGGQPPVGIGEPKGCSFAPRCPSRMTRCDEEAPGPTILDSGRIVRCWAAAASVSGQASSEPTVTSHA
jgi:oligopeptide/dipeptide ABC transporter ATP-binding protein